MAVIVKRKKGENEEQLISRFKRKTFDVREEAVNRKHYIKPSERRKEKKYRIKHFQDLERKRNK